MAFYFRTFTLTFHQTARTNRADCKDLAMKIGETMELVWNAAQTISESASSGALYQAQVAKLHEYLAMLKTYVVNAQHRHIT